MATGKNFLINLGLVLGLDHILNKTFLLNFKLKNIVNHSVNCNHLRNLWQCLECTKTEKKRYNPFSAINFDKYDPVQITESKDIAEFSNVLESCKSYNPESSKTFFKKTQILKFYHISFLIT